MRQGLWLLVISLGSCDEHPQHLDCDRSRRKFRIPPLCFCPNRLRGHDPRAKARCAQYRGENAYGGDQFCADGGNLPFSNTKSEGFENKIAEIIANAIGAKLTYYWRPSLERGATRAVFDNSVCDVLIDIPANWEGGLTTLPLYRTTYVLAYRNDKGITPFKSLDDPEP